MSSASDKRARLEQLQGDDDGDAHGDGPSGTKRVRSIGCSANIDVAEEPTAADGAQAAAAAAGVNQQAVAAPAAKAPAPAEAAEEEDSSEFGVFPDAVVQRILFFAARDSSRPALRPPCSPALELAGGELDEPDFVPQNLRRLRNVNRRFRKLIDDPDAVDAAAWERVILRLGKANCAQNRALNRCSWPASAAARLRTRRLRVETYDLYPQRLRRLREIFPNVTHIDVFWDGGCDSSIANLAEFPNLRSVAFRVKSVFRFDTFGDDFRGSLSAVCCPAWRVPAVDPVTQQARGLRELDLSGIPLELKHLAPVAFSALAPSLETLFIDVVPPFLASDPEAEAVATARPVLAKVSELTALKRLRIGFWGEEEEGSLPNRKVWPVCEWEDSTLLARLTAMESLDAGCKFKAIEFLSRMPKLAALSLALHPDASAAPLASRASSLRFLRLRQGHAAIPEQLFLLGALEAVDLRLSWHAFQKLGRTCLKGWTSLRQAELRCSPSSGLYIPGGVFTRLALDVPSLRRIVTWSPFQAAVELIVSRALGNDEKLQASPCGLRELVLRGSAAGPLMMSADREAVPILLPGVRVRAEEDAECSEGEESDSDGEEDEETDMDEEEEDEEDEEEEEEDENEVDEDGDEDQEEEEGGEGEVEVEEARSA
eukprot:tig00020909_g15322.t1